jgi:hypothetical protein
MDDDTYFIMAPTSQNKARAPQNVGGIVSASSGQIKVVVGWFPSIAGSASALLFAPERQSHYYGG